MKHILAIFALVAIVPAHAIQSNPISKVLEMISSLQQKLIAEGAEVQKAYAARTEYCEENAQNLGFEIKTGKGNVASLKASIEDEAASVAALSSKIEDKSSDISTNEEELKSATSVREKEAANFAAEEKELMQAVDSMERAISVISKEMGGASMLQVKSAGSVTKALSLMVEAAAISTDDASKLTAFVQQSSEDEDSDEDSEMGAPSAAAYENQSGGIVSTLEGLLEKAQTQLDKARKAESVSKQNYAMLKQSLTDEIKFSSKDMDEAKMGLASSKEKKATAEGDLTATAEDLKADLAAKKELHHACLTAAQEFEAAVQSRAEELAALAKAKKVIESTTGGAVEQTYSFVQVSLLQVSSQAKAQPKFEVVRVIRNLAARHKSAALSQLASRMNSAIRLSATSGADPFAKVKGLIMDMLSQLEAAAEADASQKAYCDKEMSETAEKKEDKSSVVDSLTTKIAQRSAASAKLKEEVATLQKELASMTKAQAESSQLRQEETAQYLKFKPEMEQGLRGVQAALKVLKEYYAKDQSSGESNGIIGLLEVTEGDFSKGVAEMTVQEETAQAEFEEETKAFEVEKAAKEKDVQYKTQEFKGLDKAVTELSGDLSGSQEQLDAILEYDAKVKKQCVAKPEPYEVRKEKREAEIAGLKEALTTLENESFLQTSSKRRLRASHRHMA